MSAFPRSLLAALAVAAIGAGDAASETTAADGAVRGRVEIGRATPSVERFTISKDVDVCPGGTRDVPRVRANGRALLDAVVYLEGVKGGRRFPAASKKVTINQRKCRFEPFLSVMANGGQLEAVNSDPVLHNIHVYRLLGSVRSTVMNISQPEKGNIAAKRIDLAEGNVLKIECDAHDFMHAYVFVARNPYYAVVDRKGEFAITGVPPGKYRIKVWHAELGTLSREVEIAAGRTAIIDFAY